MYGLEDASLKIGMLHYLNWISDIFGNLWNPRKNNLEEVTEENFCELATKDAEMGNIVIGVYRCFIGDILDA